MKMTSLQDLFLHTLQDIYYAEQQIVKSLPDMAKKADSADDDPWTSTPAKTPISPSLKTS